MLPIGASNLTAGAAAPSNPGGSGTVNTGGVNFAAGAFIVVSVFGVGAGQSVPTLTGSGGVAWTQRANVTGPSNTQMTVFSGVSVAGFTNAFVTLTWTGGGAAEPAEVLWSIDQFTNVLGSVTQAPTNSGTSASPSVPLAMPANGSARFGAFGALNGSTLSPGEGFTQLGSASAAPGNDYELLTEYAIFRTNPAAGAGVSAPFAAAALEIAGIDQPGDMNVHLLDMGFGEGRRRVEVVGY